MVKVAEKILEQGYIKLKVAFQIVSPNVTYNVLHARRKLLQMPLANLGIDEKSQARELLGILSRKTDHSALRYFTVATK